MQYSIQSPLPSGVPVLPLPGVYGSRPANRHHVTDSSVPKVLGASAPQALSKLCTSLCSLGVGVAQAKQASVLTFYTEG